MERQSSYAPKVVTRCKEITTGLPATRMKATEENLLKLFQAAGQNVRVKVVFKERVPSLFGVIVSMRDIIEMSAQQWADFYCVSESGEWQFIPRTQVLILRNSSHRDIQECVILFREVLDTIELISTETATA